MKTFFAELLFHIQTGIVLPVIRKIFINRLKNPVRFQKKVIQEITRLHSYREAGESVPCLDILHYAKTSGTTDKAKFIPVTRKGLQIQKYGLRIFAAAQYRAFPEAFRGRILAVTGPAEEGITESGIPYGSTSGMIYRDMPASVKGKYLLPEAVFSVKDYQLKYRLILRVALRERNITSAAMPNPSTLQILIALLDEEWNEILEEIRTGKLNLFKKNAEWETACADPELSRIINELRMPDPERFSELMDLVRPGYQIKLTDIWPGLRALGTWTKGNCGETLSSVRHRIGNTARISELGYLASECRGTVNIDPKRNITVPLVDSVYYEFVKRQDYESGRYLYMTLDQLEPGNQYYIFVTTFDGLRRYNMNDIMYVPARYYSTPVLEFVQKGQGVTSLTGEKLYEWQTLEALRRTCRHFKIKPVFSMTLADLKTGYTFFLEPESFPDVSEADLAQMTDKHLSIINSEYESRRAGGRLPLPAVRILASGAGEAYRRHHVNSGRGDWQFKTVTLGYRKNESFDFEKYLSFRYQKNFAEVSHAG